MEHSLFGVIMRTANLGIKREVSWKVLIQKLNLKRNIMLKMLHVALIPVQLLSKILKVKFLKRKKESNKREQYLRIK